MKAWRLIGAILVLASASPTLSAPAEGPMSLKAYMALSGPAPTAKLTYGPAPRQYVELFEPAGAGPFPVAVLIHGGCFLNSFEGMQQLRGLAGALAARGVAAWSIEYRGLDTTGGGYPGTFQDINAAMNLLQAEAGEWHLNTGRLVAVGHSAGAYLALWLAGRGRIPKLSPLHEANPLPVRQVVALGGSGDLRPAVASFSARCALDLGKLTGAPSAARPDVYADTTPAEMIPNSAHTVFINGAQDTIATSRATAAYAARVRRTGDSVQVIVIPGASHFDEPTVGSPAWASVQAAILRAVGVKAPPALARSKSSPQSRQGHARFGGLNLSNGSTEMPGPGDWNATWNGKARRISQSTGRRIVPAGRPGKPVIIWVRRRRLGLAGLKAA